MPLKCIILTFVDLIVLVNYFMIFFFNLIITMTLYRKLPKVIKIEACVRKQTLSLTWGSEPTADQSRTKNNLRCFC